MKKLEIIEAKKKLTSNEIQNSANKLGLVFPEEYEKFLIINNGGHPVKNAYPLIEYLYNDENILENAGNVSWFLAIHEGEYNNLEKNYLAFRGHRVPSELLTVACDSTGNRICLCISGSNYGKVYFWDHENENPEDDNPWYKNIYLIANSFTDFINSLYAFDFEDDSGTGKTIKYISTHDRYSLPYSNHVKKFGDQILSFFSQAPLEIEDFIIEDIQDNGNIVLYYNVKSKGQRHIKEMDNSGKVLSERTGVIPSVQ